MMDTKDQTSSNITIVWSKRSEKYSIFLKLYLIFDSILKFQYWILISCYRYILMFVLVSVHLTAADGPGDRFIIGESQAGEQVRFIGLKGPKDFSFVDF